MARRGGNAPDAPVEVPGQKRKRQPSQDPAPSLKVTLPSAASLQTIPKVKLTLSPTKANGALPDAASEGNDAKRQKISLKLNGSKVHDVKTASRTPSAAGEEDAEGEEEEDAAEAGVENGEAELKESIDALSRDVREALILVIEQMALGLPKPLNSILTLWLPPSFEEVKTNTLECVLRRNDLTWDELVELLHVLSRNLLAPCAYPNPLPALEHIHLPVPPLASHQPPHGIYNFCAALRDVLLAIEPVRVKRDGEKQAQKWALMMRGPTSKTGTSGTWWTSLVDHRTARDALVKLHAASEGSGESLLELLAADGNKFGFAMAVPISSIADPNAAAKKAPKLGKSVLQKASLKAKQWKDAYSRTSYGSFGELRRPVTIPHTPSVWTPSFASTYDSNSSSGGMGYWSTLDAMHSRARFASWREHLSADKQTVNQGYWGSLPEKGESEPEAGVLRSTTDTLLENAGWINELLGWQETRAFSGEKEVGEREASLADALQRSLVDLASSPSSLLTQSLGPGEAHKLAKRLIPTSGPAIRGILEPSRAKAVHDNHTLRIKPPTTATSTAAPSMSQQLAGQSTRSYQPQTNTPTPAPVQAQRYNYPQSASRPSASLPVAPSPLPQHQHSQPSPGYGTYNSQQYRPPIQQNPYGYNAPSPAPQSPYGRPPGSMMLPQSPSPAPQYQQSCPQQGYAAPPPPTNISSWSPQQQSPQPLPPQQLQQQQPQQAYGYSPQQGVQQQMPYLGYGRPGMAPSGLRQSFGPT